MMPCGDLEGCGVRAAGWGGGDICTHIGDLINAQQN